jgi:hypothetical protein
VEVRAAKAVKAAAVETEAVEAKAAEVAAACIGSVGMCRKSTEADGADGATVNTQVSEAVKVVRTRLNWMVLVCGSFCCM